MALWAGRLSGNIDERLNALNASIGYDSRMFAEDIEGSVAHANMLGKIGILTSEETKALTAELAKISEEISSGALSIDQSAEDIHMFIEAELTKRLGTLGKKLHTARSRNDQVALDIRLYLNHQSIELNDLLKQLVSTICDIASKHLESVMPGYTHLQRAQPVTLAHYLMAYAQMFLRDISRLVDSKKRLCIMPLGSGALAGTTYPLDRQFVCDQLGFNAITANSIDGVSDRDFVLEFANILSIIMMHLSRFSEEIILWSSWEYQFISLSDQFSTGSSIMPQKKNPDLAELVRGKTARVYGDQFTLLTMMKGLPLAYNKDMQEDKEAIFDALDTVKQCLAVFSPMLSSAVFHTDKMKKAAQEGFINATDCADYLVKKGLAFRDAYKITGQLVNTCIKEGYTLDSLPLALYQKACSAFSEDIYQAIDLIHCVNMRSVEGGPSPKCVFKQIADVRHTLQSL